MWIRSFRVRNHMSFLDTGEFELSPGMNTVVGKNNAGKTALLRAISNRFDHNPHRSSLYSRDHVYNPSSVTDLQVSVTSAELSNILLGAGDVVHIPIDGSKAQKEPRGWLNEFLDLTSVVFRVTARGGGGWDSTHYPSHQLFSAEHSKDWHIQVTTNPTRTNLVAHGQSSGQNDNVGIIVGQALRQKMYMFDAQRLNVGRCHIGNQANLAPNAANLAEVLLILQDNRHRFDTLIDLLRGVFPTVKSISVRPTREDGRIAEIRIWNVDPKGERDDLAIPLNESGTGIGQVLAIIYVLLLSEANVVLIDEPNSFLHPSASRELVHILKEHSHHQFVISTHSPETIAGARPDLLLVLKWRNEQTEVSVLPRDDVVGVQEALNEVGSRLSDVFGADAIVWVEGPTEEACFRRILRAANTELASTVSVVALRNTGDLEAKRPSPEAIWEVYRRLSQSNSLMPRALAFSLDREGRSKDKMADLDRMSGGLVKFLPRRMFENYLLHAQAIAATINELPTFESSPISAELVQLWINNKGGDASYFVQRSALPPSEEKWIVEVDGAKLLFDLFYDLSSTRESYQKVAHATKLTRVVARERPRAP